MGKKFEIFKYKFEEFKDNAIGCFTVLLTLVYLTLLVGGFNSLFMCGNRGAERYIKRYIQESDTIIVPLNCDYEYKCETVTSFISRGGAGEYWYNTYTFYSNKYKKYMRIYTFNGFNVYKQYSDNGKSYLRDAEAYGFRGDIIRYGLYDEKLVSFRVNRKQWNDPAYGTKENPMPIFWLKVLSNYNMDYSNYAIVNDDVNENFVKYYLILILPKEEFKRLYENDMENEW